MQAALTRPRQHAHYGEADLALQSAVLAHGIAEGQLFVDGNKRTALVALKTFLQVNGYRLSASQDELAAWVLSLGSGRSVDDLAGSIRASMKKSAE